jgi:hypothetical protein
MTIQLDADRSLTCTMTAAEWNFVLSCIGEAPFKLAQPVISKLMSQIEKQTSEGTDVSGQDQR